MKESEDIGNLKIALGSYFLVFALKLAAFFLTGVMALLAEALHTLSDIFVTGFLLFAAHHSRRAADPLHMFGHGRAQHAGALVAGTLFLSFTSYKLFEEALPRLFHPGQTAYQHLGLAVAVIAGSMLIAAVPLVRLFLQKNRGAAAKAQFLESINDELGLVAALVGTLFVVWGEPVADPIASIVVATIIALNGIKLFAENFSFLLGRSPGPERLARMEASARSVPGVLGVHDLRAELVGPEEVHADMHIHVRAGIPVEEAHHIAAEVTRRLHLENSPSFCIVHVDPSPPETAPAADSGSPKEP